MPFLSRLESRANGAFSPRFLPLHAVTRVPGLPMPLERASTLATSYGPMPSHPSASVPRAWLAFVQSQFGP